MKDHHSLIKSTDSPLALFRNSQFSWLYASNMAFFFAMNAQNIVRAWLAFKLTDSELALGMVMFAVAVPMFFMSPIGGVIADRKDRRNLIIMGQGAVFLIDLSVFLLLCFDKLQFWHLVAASGLSGCAFPFIMPTRNAIIVNVVGKGSLERAMALNMAGVNTTRVLGPAAAGLLIDLVGVTNTYLMGVVLYGVGMACMTRVNSSKPVMGKEKISAWASVIEGFRYVGEHRLILVLLLFGLVPMFLAMPFQNLLVVFAEKIWHVGSQGFGLLSAATGIGGIVGSVWIALVKQTHDRLFRMMISMLGFGTALFCFTISPYFLLGLLLVFVANVCVSVFNTMNNTAIQLLIPDEVRGRISSFLMMSFSLPMLGTLPVSAVAEAYGAPFAVGLAAILAVLVALAFYLLSAQLRGMNMGISNAMKEE